MRAERGTERNTAQTGSKVKGGWLELAKHLGHVLHAGQGMGDRRESGYRCKDLYDQSGEAALHELSRHKPNLMNFGDQDR